MNAERFTLGIDIGGTHCRAALVGADGCIIAAERTHTPRGGEPTALAATVQSLAATLHVRGGGFASAAGVALPGIRVGSAGVMQRAVHLPLLEGVAVRTLLQEALRLPVTLETDVNAAGWAQWQRLEPRPARLLYLSIGTGVGGCVILDGQIVRHTNGGAGHFGFLVVDSSPGAPKGRAGVAGSLEAVLAESVGGLRETEASAAMIARAADALATAIHLLAHIFAPSDVLLGGGVVDHEPKLIDAVRECLRAKSAAVVALPRVSAAPLRSDDAGVIGAALLAGCVGSPD